MKKMLLAVTAVLALGAGAAVVDAQRHRADRGAVAGDDAQIDQGRGARGMFGRAMRQGRGPGGFLQGPGRGGFGRGGRGALGGPMFAALDLTGDQRTKIQEIHRASRDAMQPVAEQLRDAQRALHVATFADQRDDAEIARLTSAVANLEKQMLEQRVKTELDVAAVLTAEQREKLRAGRGAGR
jgi:Spy/CpxP family protein refolding chaperone